MYIHKYGITLRRLKIHDIELVRNMRNRADIRNNMVYREFITPEQQYQWFLTVNNIYNHYFIIELDGLKIGMINGKNIDFENRTSEGGIVIWQSLHEKPYIAALCSAILNDYTFIINEFNSSKIKVLKTNKSAISYNEKIGYAKISTIVDSNEYDWYELTKESFLKNIPMLRKGIGNITGDFEPLKKLDFWFKDDTDHDLRELYSPLPNYLKEKINVCLSRENRILV